MIVFDDGFASVEWYESTIYFSVIINKEPVDCFAVYDISDKREAIDAAYDHMKYFYSELN